MIITIIGNIGSGKSTALPIVSKAINALSLDADNLFQTNDPFAQEFLRNQERWAFANELWLMYERVKLIESEVAEHKDQRICIDSGLLISWVYANSHFQAGTMTTAEWQLFSELYQRLSQNILGQATVIYLEYSTNTLLQRIRKRGRDYELEFYTQSYLEEQNKGLEALCGELQLMKVPVLTIEETEVADFQHSKKDRERMIEMVTDFVNQSE